MLGEVEEAVQCVNKYHNKLSLLHCSIKYPTILNECNLGIINTLKLCFPDNKIGYSDHAKEISTAAVQAVYLGAEIIEKHITLDKNMSGPDHFFALEPKELKKMVVDIRRAEVDLSSKSASINKKIYGTSKKTVFGHEEYLRKFCFSSLFAKKNISKGQVIKEGDLIILRPGKNKLGLIPKYYFLFQKYRIRAVRDINSANPIKWEDIFET